MQSAHIAEERGFTAAVHALPDNVLIAAMLITNFLTIAHFLEQASGTVDLSLYSLVCSLSFLFTVNKAPKERTLTSVALIESAPVHSIVLLSTIERIVYVL